MPWAALNGRHPNTAQCTKVAERKCHSLAVEKARAGTERAFREYSHPLTNVAAFKYLDRILSSVDCDWTEVVVNLRKARKKWARMSRILGQEGANAQTSGTFFKAVVQAVLLFGSEMWVVTPHVSRTLGGFQHRGRPPADWESASAAARRRMGVPPPGGTMREAGLEEVEEYIAWRQHTVTQYIATRPILDLCEEAKRRPGTQISKRRWEQEGLNLAGARAEAATAGETGEAEGGRRKYQRTEAGG